MSSDLWDTTLASRNVSLNTKPLLVYYCFLNLTKASLFLENKMVNKDYHGLCKHSLIGDLLDFSAEINQGVFLDLAKSLNCDIKSGTRLSLDGCCKNMIELTADYAFYFKREQNIIVPEINIYNNGEVELIFNKTNLLTIDALENKIKDNTNLLGDFKVAKKTDGLLRLLNINKLDIDDIKGDGIRLMEKHFLFSVYRNNEYYLNINNKIDTLPQMLAYFGASFILGSLVRYDPVRLYELLYNNEKSMKWFIATLTEKIDRVYPNLIINFFMGESFKYSSGCS